jgi:hypothetical protein
LLQRQHTLSIAINPVNHTVSCFLGSPATQTQLNIVPARTFLMVSLTVPVAAAAATGTFFVTFLVLLTAAAAGADTATLAVLTFLPVPLLTFLVLLGAAEAAAAGAAAAAGDAGLALPCRRTTQQQQQQQQQQQHVPSIDINSLSADLGHPGTAHASFISSKLRTTAAHQYSCQCSTRSNMQLHLSS